MLKMEQIWMIFFFRFGVKPKQPSLSQNASAMNEGHPTCYHVIIFENNNIFFVICLVVWHELWGRRQMADKQKGQLMWSPSICMIVLYIFIYNTILYYAALLIYISNKIRSPKLTLGISTQDLFAFIYYYIINPKHILFNAPHGKVSFTQSKGHI